MSGWLPPGTTDRMIDESCGGDSGEQFRLRVVNGWQCPECYGVRTTNRGTHRPHGWQCTECGCSWSEDYYTEPAE